MAGKRDADVDPRFDPVFQRGYDPAVHTARGRPARSEQPREAVPPAPAPEPVSSPVEVAAPAAGAETSPTPAPDYEPPRYNPFRLILLVTSLAAIAGAGALLWRRIATDPYGGYGGYGGDTARIFVDQLMDASLAPLLTGGLLGICLWIALGALRRRDDADRE
jgi:hypothetical protein